MLWGLVGEAAGMYLRTEFFQALMKQEVGFFESERFGRRGNFFWISAFFVILCLVQQGHLRKLSTLMLNLCSHSLEESCVRSFKTSPRS